MIIYSDFFVKIDVLRSGHEDDGLGLVLVPLGYLDVDLDKITESNWVSLTHFGGEVGSKKV